MRIALVFLFLLCGVGVFAESQPPAPSGANPATQPKSHPQNTKSETNGNKPATKLYPPAIEIAKAPIMQVESTDKTEKRRDYSSSEWWLVYITGLLALITGALAWYTSRLYKATVGIGKDAIDLAQRSAFNDAADGFFFHFHNALHEVEGSSVGNMIDFDKVFANYYDQHLRAIRKFKRFLSETERTEIDNVWNYHCWNESSRTWNMPPNFAHYSHGQGIDFNNGKPCITEEHEVAFERAKQLAINNLERLLSFAKLK